MEVLHRSAEGLQHLCGHKCDLDRFEWEKRPSVNRSGVLLLDLCANHTLNTVLKNKGVHICMRHQDFVIIPSDLQLYVLDMWVKSSPADHHLVTTWLGRWENKHTVRLGMSG